MSSTGSTRDLLRRYYAGLQTKDDWESILADDFLLLGTAVKETKGRDLYAGNGFFKLVRGHRVRELVVEGDKGFALVNYDLASPSGKMMSCDVAELWRAEGTKLASVSIYFDTAAFGAFLAK